LCWPQTTAAQWFDDRRDGYLLENARQPPANTSRSWFFAGALDELVYNINSRCHFVPSSSFGHRVQFKVSTILRLLLAARRISRFGYASRCLTIAVGAEAVGTIGAIGRKICRSSDRTGTERK
jgi:hypothetical protein